MESPIPFDLAVFDIAGTTVYDPDGVGGCLKAALEAASIPYSFNEVNRRMGIPKPVAIREVLELAGFRDAALVEKIHLDFQSRMRNFYAKNEDVRPIEGVEETFQELRDMGIRVALDTGFDRSIVEVLLHRLRWEDGYLDATVCSDEVAKGRPAPDMIYRAMDLTGFTDTSRVIKAGDTPSDIAQGYAARCRWVVGVTSGTHTEVQLRVHQPTHLLGSVAELPALIRLESTIE